MWQLLTGGALSSIKDIIAMIFGNREKRDDARHSEHVALQDAYSKEFSYSAANRTWWDGLWDGINRMPRPLMALGTIALFTVAYLDPDEFKRMMVAMQAVPEMLWWLLFTVISFYFSGRVLDKIKVSAPSLRSIRPPDAPAVGLHSNTADDGGSKDRTANPAPATGNPSIDAWKAAENG